MKMIIYLDMDLVCTQFIESAAQLHGYNISDLNKKWTAQFPGVFHMEKVLGISRDAFWNKIHDEGEKFWVDLEETKWFRELYDKLEEIGRVYFLSAVTQSPSCLSGKLIWLQDRFGKEFDRYILTANKHLLANGHSVLIDDYDKNVNAFSQNGGCGILFPTIYNINIDKVENRIEYILSEIQKFKDLL